ncbi:MAG: molybdate ABC transporter permease subunit [Erysipelotrichaceae bacterium]|uniref:molybdate ABC transporter permease subunit n=1 Tax=Floccifex sp. TaxID=2815810 RepID=UPI002A75BE9C|nr:molybdate ABC transporter permease subunit [Floccifex sp.]MDD7281367.1 molybdate ABC transporter permease subunit [Erysipelotrichaceae bacterium]MDY2958894.1 molybdate ABC transporter permease subunit [Floccifex sp.]
MNVLENIDLSPLWISLKSSSITICFTFVLGILAAWFVISTQRKWLKILIDGLFTLPLVLPPTVMGFFLLLVFGVNQPVGKLVFNLFGVRIAFSFSATVIASFFISFPLMYRSTRSAFEQVDPDLISAARTLGMSEFQILIKVIIPNAITGLVSGTILAFARGLGEFGATAMLAGNIIGKTRTLPLAVYSDVMSGDMESASIYVFIIVVICFVLVIALNLYQFFVKKKRGYSC